MSGVDLADPAVEGFLACSPHGARPHRRRLSPRPADLAAHLGRPPADASADEIEGWLADLRAAVRPELVARRGAAARHALPPPRPARPRPDNPAAEVDLPRVAELPRSLSLGEVERLIERERDDAARLRDRALVELLYGAGLRVGEAVAWSAAASTSTSGSSAAWARATRSASCRSGAQAVEALRRYLARGRPYLDRRHRPRSS